MSDKIVRRRCSSCGLYSSMYGMCAWRCAWAFPGRVVDAADPACCLWLPKHTVPYDVRVALDLLCSACDDLLAQRDAAVEAVWP